MKAVFYKDSVTIELELSPALEQTTVRSSNVFEIVGKILEDKIGHNPYTESGYESALSE